ncbi:MAG: PilZ domain-containing protein [Deltaproteobacteria bacterium]|nr:PilZ domain-containing protein [Deltaproteobacteria bacterium]
MTNTQEQTDRRRQKRFNVQDGAFVAVGPHFDKVGPIIDVSMRGLAFHYLALGKQENGLSADIFLTNSDFFMGYVPFEVVRDFEVPNTQPPGIATMRRCSLQFGNLTQGQVSKLRLFINTSTERTPGLYDIEQERRRDHSYSLTSKGNQEVLSKK